MARKRTRTSSDGTGQPIMPLAILGHGMAAFRGRHEWFASHGIDTWQEKHEAIGRSRDAHGLPSRRRDSGAPDPRELFRGITTSPPIRPRRRPPARDDREASIPEQLPPPF